MRYALCLQRTQEDDEPDAAQEEQQKEAVVGRRCLPCVPPRRPGDPKKQRGQSQYDDGRLDRHGTPPQSTLRTSTPFLPTDALFDYRLTVSVVYHQHLAGA